MFRGRFNHTIDPKGRLSIPAGFRNHLAQYEGDLVVVPNQHCLEVYPLDEWRRIEEKIHGQSLFKPEVRDLGRILLPPDSRKDAGLEKDVTLVGGGLPMFEVWDRARFEEYERTRSDALPSLFQSLAADGV